MSLYLTKLQLQAELDRCLQCKTQPCMSACPVSCNPREFIQHARNGEWDQAVHAIVRNNPMGQTCGLICPDSFCMHACTRCHVDFPINIPRVQATILHNYRTDSESHAAPDAAARVAVIGAGPAGISASAVLLRHGIRVDIYEARDRIGGALNMIPPTRLPHDVIERDWSFIASHSHVSLFLNHPVHDVRALAAQYDAVIVATGEPNALSLRIPGEELAVSYMDYLYRPEEFATDGPVAVIGGGNVAADCALTAHAHGASSVEMFIRRRIADMRVTRKTLAELLDAGINLHGMTSPEKIDDGGDTRTLWIHRNVQKDGKWTTLPDSTIPLRYFRRIVCAIGSRADEKIADCPNVVYAGDCSTGGSTIVQAIASGRDAAESVLAAGALPQTP